MTGPPAQKHQTITLFDERQAEALAAVLAERLRQEKLWREGKFKHTLRNEAMPHWACLTACTEELGEVAKLILNYEDLATDFENDGGIDLSHELRKEVTELAALCLAWLEGEW